MLPKPPKSFDVGETLGDLLSAPAENQLVCKKYRRIACIFRRSYPVEFLPVPYPFFSAAVQFDF